MTIEELENCENDLGERETIEESYMNAIKLITEASDILRKSRLHMRRVNKTGKTIDLCDEIKDLLGDLDVFIESTE